MDDRKSVAIAELEPAVAKANSLATPEFLEECKNAANRGDQDFQPRVPIRATAGASYWIKTHPLISSKGPSHGGDIVAFIAPYDEIGLFGQKTPMIGGCSAEIVDGRLSLIEGLRGQNFEVTRVIVI